MLRFLLFSLVLPQVILAKKSKVLTVTSENWKDTLDGEWMIKFYAPWCPACKSMAEDYIAFAQRVSKLKIKVAEVNINEEAGLSGRFIVTALPTIYHAKDGKFRRYAGQRDANSLHRYVEDKHWRGTEEVAWYRHPNSIPMTFLSYLFQTSMVIKVFHETLTETYGLSTTMAYVAFGVVTIVAGLALGLVLVIIIDFIAPQKSRVQPKEPTPEKESQGGENDSAEEEDDAGDGTGRESQSSSDKGSQRSSKDVSSASEDEMQSSQKPSESSSQISQEWEKVIGGDEGMEKKEIGDDDKENEEKEEGQGELRRRKVNKGEKEKE